MARYIDAELLDPEEFENCTPYQASEIIESIPTADVVPKSEVVKIFEEIDTIYSLFDDDDEIFIGNLRTELERIKNKYAEDLK